MKTILLSFRPEIFPALLTAEKTFEYRSRIPDGEVEAYLYLSSPAKRIVGKLQLGPRRSLPELAAASDALTRRRLERHMGEGSVYASPVLSLSLFELPVTLDEARKLEPRFRTPQGFLYLEKYPVLFDLLKNRPCSVYEINPTQSTDQLGLYSDEILANYPVKISAF